MLPGEWYDAVREMNRELLRIDLRSDEGLRLVVYDDATGQSLRPGMTIVGHPTIGYGRALDVHGLSQAESNYLLENDIDRVLFELNHALPWFASLDDSRQRVLIEMAFNIGIHALCGFHETLRYIEQGRYEMAAAAMRDSLWAREVGARAVRLAGLMKSGAA